jgi:hypothetical protein
MKQEPPCARIHAGLQKIAQTCSRGPEAGATQFLGRDRIQLKRI